MKQQQMDDIRKISLYYGLEQQNEIAMEEASELIQAIQKCKRDASDVNVDNYCEEIADVIIIVNQLRLLADTEKIDDYIEYKLKRQLERIEIEKECKIQRYQAENDLRTGYPECAEYRRKIANWLNELVKRK